MLLNSDSHGEDDLLTAALAKDTLVQAGVNSREIDRILETNPEKLLQRIRRRS
jgi:hypothetical protein